MWEAFLEHSPYKQEDTLYLWNKQGMRGNEDNEVVIDFVSEKVAIGATIPEDAGITMWHGDMENFLRAIMTVAWDRGIRPEGYENHTNEIKRLDDHLQDMRKLAGATTDDS